MLTTVQRAEYERQGYVVLDLPPDLAILVRECASAAALVQAAHDPAAVAEVDGAGNHWRLRPQRPGSYHCALDASEPFLAVSTHPAVVAVARQLAGFDDVYLCIGSAGWGINELAPGRSAEWHHDPAAWAGDGGVEFMSYFNEGGSWVSNGCLRVIPGSHRHPSVLRVLRTHRREQLVADSNAPRLSDFDLEVQRQRAEAGLLAPRGGAWKDGVPEDAQMPGEVSLPLGPGQLLARHTRLFHATHLNGEREGRLMHHFTYRTDGANARACSPLAIARWRWEDCLTPALLARLTAEQRAVLRIGQPYGPVPMPDTYPAQWERLRFGTLTEALQVERIGVEAPRL